MDCPDCGGPMWDNRGNKRNPKQPDYKCKDKDGCGKGVWEQARNGGGNRGGSGAGKSANGAGSVRSTRPLGPLYYAAMQIAAETVKRLVPNATPTDIVAATATLFIGATNTGAPLRAPAPKPAPPPPPPQEYDEHPGDEENYGEAALPF